MRLWVLRHGEAEPRANSDAERRLTAHGREQVLRSAAQLLGCAPQVILASPYVRAQQTAALVHEALGLTSRCRPCPGSPRKRPAAGHRRAGQAGVEQVLLVSHQPLVGTLVCLLEHGHRKDPAPMGTASLAELDGDHPWPG